MFQDLKLENMLLVKLKEPDKKRTMAKLADFGLFVELDRQNSNEGPVATQLTGETGSAIYM